MRYSKDHCWVEKNENGVKIGITGYLHSKICKNFVINLCDEGDRVRAGDIIGDVESCDFFDIISPVSGTVVSVNDEALDNPQIILSENPWLIEMTDVAFTQPLMSENEYNSYLNILK